jgi:S1-C subfamily serine protease
MSTINADLGSGIGPAALIKTADDTDTLVIQTNGVDAVTIGTDQNVVADTTGAWVMPIGTTAQRPGTATEGMTRFNTTIGSMEIYSAGNWMRVP